MSNVATLDSVPATTVDNSSSPNILNFFHVRGFLGDRHSDLGKMAFQSSIYIFLMVKNAELFLKYVLNISITLSEYCKFCSFAHLLIT